MYDIPKPLGHNKKLHPERTIIRIHKMSVPTKRKFS